MRSAFHRRLSDFLFILACHEHLFGKVSEGADSRLAREAE